MVDCKRALTRLCLLLLAGCAAPPAESERQPPRPRQEFQRQLIALSDANRQLEDILLEQKSELRKLQARIEELERELSSQRESQEGLERREETLKERLLSARLENVRLWNDLYTLKIAQSEKEHETEGR